jgi:RimJ/RimL family protein N-acetyltransferase
VKHSFALDYNTVLLRPLEETDIDSMRLLRNKCRNSFINSNEISSEEQRKWYQNYLGKPGDYMFSIIYRDAWVGAVALYNVDSSHAEFGRLMINKEVTGRKGLGVEATIGACKIGFEQLGLSTICLEVYADNLAAIKTYERSGFLVCGQTDNLDGRTVLKMICRRKGEE